MGRTRMIGAIVETVIWISMAGMVMTSTETRRTIPREGVAMKLTTTILQDQGKIVTETMTMTAPSHDHGHIVAEAGQKRDGIETTIVMTQALLGEIETGTGVETVIDTETNIEIEAKKGGTILMRGSIGIEIDSITWYARPLTSYLVVQHIDL